MIKESTVEIALTIESEDENQVVTPVNLTTVGGLVVVAYNEGNKIVAQWSKNSQTNFDPIDTTGTGTDAVNGLCIVRLQSSNTASALLKFLKLEVHVFQTNANFDDNIQHDIVNEIEVETMKNVVLQKAVSS